MKTKISLELDNIVTTWQISNDEDCNLSNLIEAFAGMLVAHTFVPDSVYKHMKEYGEEHLKNE